MNFEVVHIKTEEDITGELKGIFENSKVIHEIKVEQKLIHNYINKKIFHDILYKNLLTNLNSNNNNKNNKNKYINNEINKLLNVKSDIIDIIDLVNFTYMDKFELIFKEIHGIVNYTRNNLKLWNTIIDNINELVNLNAQKIYEEIRIINYNYPMFIKNLATNTIIIMKLKDNEKKIAGYLQFTKDINSIYIEYIETHPDFRGQKICNNLIEILVNEFPNITIYKLNNAGGLIGYKCYINTFRKLQFIPTGENKNINNLNKNINKNSNRLKTAKNNNKKKINNNLQFKYSNTYTFTKKNANNKIL
jgi:hypothetical protein